MKRSSITMPPEGKDGEAAPSPSRFHPLLAASSRAQTRILCFHCGARCLGEAVTDGVRSFCCLGCRSVCELLTDGGLGQYYELASAPGARVGAATAAAQWAFLEAPSVQEKLLDYADARQAKVTFHLPAMHCVACVWLLENLFRLQPGIGASRVNFGRREVGITFDPAEAKLSQIAALLASLGYEPAFSFQELDRTARQEMPTGQRRQWLQVGVAGFGFGNVMLMALPTYLGLDSLSGPWFQALAGRLGLVLAFPVLVYSAADFWRAAWLSFRQRVFTLEVPIAVGLLAIYGQSAYEVMSGRGAGYCDSLTGLIFFLLCGRIFQRRSFERLAFDRDYKGFFPLAVLRKSASGEVPVAISELAVGDRLLIRNGELVPADARVVKGAARIDYSFVTGESVPVSRTVGERLFAGGRQEGETIEIETVKAVSESYLTTLWNHESFRKDRNNSLNSITNRYSRRFTLGVLGLALAAAGYWMWVDASVAMKAFVSVLIVACPCALALAAPLTLGSAQRWLAGRRVFLRNAQVVEHLAAVDTIVLDKTGTLTSPGAGSVTWHGAALSDNEQCSVAATARHSAHPLSVRVGEVVGQSHRLPLIQAFCEIPGCGVEGRVDGRDFWLGSEAWLKSRGAESVAVGQADPQNRTGSGRNKEQTDRSDRPSPAVGGNRVHVAINGEYRGYYRLESLLRPEVEVLLDQLRGAYQLVLLSGDHAQEAERFRALLGEQARIEFNQTPFDKLNVIRELQAAGHSVMMVGDGLNDAGALQQAEVGIAVVEKVGVFSPASDVIIEAEQLPRLANILVFSRRAAQVVRIGFLLSGLYNIVGISIAAAGWLSPLVCAVLMPVSSVTVVLFAVSATQWLARRSFGPGEKSQKRPSPKRPPAPLDLAAAIAFSEVDS